jgi:hypothetical protein
MVDNLQSIMNKSPPKSASLKRFKTNKKTDFAEETNRGATIETEEKEEVGQDESGGVSSPTEEFPMKKVKLGRGSSFASPTKITRRNSVLSPLKQKSSSPSPGKRKLDPWIKHSPEPICSGCISNKKR